MRASTALDPLFEWLNRAAAAADWGLPEAGPAAALLRLDASDWEPPGYCPVHDVLKSARAGGPAPWHNNIRSSQDPLTGLLSLEVCISHHNVSPAHALSPCLGRWQGYWQMSADAQCMMPHNAPDLGQHAISSSYSRTGTFHSAVLKHSRPIWIESLQEPSQSDL